MKNIKNILVASELNKESYEALLYGITLGFMYDAKVSCIHVVKPSPIDIIKETFKIGSAKYGDAIKEAKEESENLLGHIIDVIAQELGVGEVDVDLNIVSGNTSNSIMSYADEIDADLVIIGTEPGSRFSRTPHTNLALNMIELQKSNVLLIPSGFRMEQIDQIGAFINFDIQEIDFIKKLIKHSKKTDNGLKLIHVIEEKDNIERAKQQLKIFKGLFSKEVDADKVEFILELGSLPQIVNGLKEKHNIDLMTINAYKRHWDMYSSANAFPEKVIKNIKSPLMIWNDPKNKVSIKVKNHKL